MNHRRALPFLLVFFLLATGHAGPAPYTSARIYLLGDQARTLGGTPAHLRKNAKKVISLVDLPVLDFFDAIRWEKARPGKNISKQGQPLIMIIDFYGRTQPPFEGGYDTLYCYPDFIYSEDGRRVPAGNILERVWALENEEKQSMR